MRSWKNIKLVCAPLTSKSRLSPFSSSASRVTKFKFSLVSVNKRIAESTLSPLFHCRENCDIKSQWSKNYQRPVLESTHITCDFPRDGYFQIIFRVRNNYDRNPVPMNGSHLTSTLRHIFLHSTDVTMHFLFRICLTSSLLKLPFIIRFLFGRRKKRQKKNVSTTFPRFALKREQVWKSRYNQVHQFLYHFPDI